MERSSTFDREQSPGSLCALQVVFALISKAESRTCDEISHGPRDPHVRGPRERGDACRDVHCDARDVVVAEFDLAGMYADAHAKTELAGCLAYCEPAFDGAGRTVKGREESVSCSLNFPAAKACELTTHRIVVTFK